MQTFPQYPVEPIVTLEGGFSPFDIWLECRAAHQLWQKGYDSGGVNDESRLQAVLLMCKRLSSFPAQRWLALNSALGWTPAAAAACTWCQNAVLSDTIEICNRLQYLASAQKNADFCARLLNPSLLPENRLSLLVNASDRQLHGTSLLIAARADLPEIDVAGNILQNFPPHLLSMLHERHPHAAVSTADGSEKVFSSANASPATVHAQESTPASSSNISDPLKKQAVPETMQNSGNTKDIAHAERQKQRQILIDRTFSLRGWTEEMVAAAKATPAQTIQVSGYGACYHYTHPETGAVIIVEAASNELLHAGRPDFAYPSLSGQGYSTIDSYTDPFYDPQTRKTMIWVPLKYELIDVWCPTPASYMERDIFCILSPLEEYAQEYMLYSVTAYVLCKPVVFHDSIRIAVIKTASL